LLRCRFRPLWPLLPCSGPPAPHAAPRQPRPPRQLCGADPPRLGAGQQHPAHRDPRAAQRPAQAVCAAPPHAGEASARGGHHKQPPLCCWGFFVWFLWAVGAAGGWRRPATAVLLPTHAPVRRRSACPASHAAPTTAYWWTRRSCGVTAALLLAQPRVAVLVGDPRQHIVSVLLSVCLCVCVGGGGGGWGVCCLSGFCRGSKS
jgi:hypothetical protein